jgi:hypothetical protein
MAVILKKMQPTPLLPQLLVMADASTAASRAIAVTGITARVEHPSRVHYEEYHVARPATNHELGVLNDKATKFKRGNNASEGYIRV